MTSITSANSAILDALNEVVDGYRRSGAPISVHSEGNVVLARIASIEFETIIVTDDEAPVSMLIHRRPVWTDGPTEMDISGWSPLEVGQAAKRQIESHLRQLGMAGLHPIHPVRR